MLDRSARNMRVFLHCFVQDKQHDSHLGFPEVSIVRR